MMTKNSKELPLNTNQEGSTEHKDVLKEEKQHSNSSGGMNAKNTKDSPKEEEIGSAVEVNKAEDHKSSKKEESANKSASDMKEENKNLEMVAENQPAPRGIRAFLRRVRKFFGASRWGRNRTGSRLAGSKAPQEEPTAKTNETNNTETAEEREAGTSAPEMTLKSFSFHQILGEGHFGKVALTTHSTTKQQYAVKVVHKWPLIQNPNDALTERTVLKIVAENRFFTHAFGTFQTKNHLFYVMEYLRGGDLRAFIRAGAPLGLPTVRFISAELLSGIQFLHHKGIIHRDLKPDNILLDSAGHIKISDFGLVALNVFEDTKITGAAGTVTYMAPEVIRNEPYNATADYYSFGIIVYQMATNTHPFFNCLGGGENRRVKREDLPVYPTFLDADLQNFMERLLCKCQKERQERVSDIQNHPLFSDINWEQLKAGEIEPPFTILPSPASKKLKKISLKKVMTPYKLQRERIKAEDDKLFDGFSFAIS